MWQDFVMVGVNLTFMLTLFPMVTRGVVTPSVTSVPTAICMFVLMVVQGSLGLGLAAVTQCVSGVLWAILAVRSLRHNQEGGTLAAMQNPVKRLVRSYRIARLAKLRQQIRSLNELLDGIEEPELWDELPGYIEEIENERTALLTQRNAILDKLRKSGEVLV